MAEPIGKGVYGGKGGIPASTEGVAPLKSQVQLNGSVSEAGIGRSLRELSREPTLLGEVGSRLTLAAASRQAKLIGQYMGQHPNGEHLPPLTDFDQWVNDSYNTQAAATLNLQATQMMYKADEQLNSSYKISPQSLQKYGQTLHQGAQDIYKNAPSDIRQQLENNFSSSLMAKMHEYNMRINTQNKEETRDKLSVSNAESSKDAFNNSVAGTIDEHYLQDFKDNLDRQVASGALSHKEAANFYNEAKINFYSGQQTRNAVSAKVSGNLEGYLRDMHGSLPNTLTPAEKIAVSDNVLSYMNKIHAYESQDNQLILSQLRRSLYEGTLSSAQLFGAESKLPTHEFNDFMTSMYSMRASERQSDKEATELASNFGNIYALSRASDKQKTAAFDMLTDAEMEKTPNADRFQIQTGIIRGAGGEIPSYTKQLDTMISRGSVNEAYAASNAIRSLMDNPNTAANIAGLSKQSLAASSIFKNLVDSQVPANQALEMARNQVYQKTDDQRAQLDMAWKDIVNHDLKSYTDREKAAKSALNANYHWYNRGNIPDLPAITNKFMSVLESNYKVAGDYDTALEMTSRLMQQVYGETRVNGRREMVYLPIEKMAGIPSGDRIPVQMDIIRSITPQLEFHKKAFDEGNVDYYYEVREGKDGETIVDTVYRGAPGKKGLRVENTIQVTASDMLQKSNDPAYPISGYYDVKLISPSGTVEPFAVVSPYGRHTFGYRPDIQRIRDNWRALHEERRLSYIPSIEETVGGMTNGA